MPGRWTRGPRDRRRGRQILPVRRAGPDRRRAVDAAEVRRLRAAAVTRRLAGATLAVLLLTGCAAEAKAPVTSPTIGRLNSAVTQATVGETICRRGWAQSVRPSSAWSSKVKRSQLPAGASMRDWVLDHVMPIELGGAPKDVANLRIVPVVRAKADDKEEDRLHRSVCDGSMTLAAARVKMSEIKRGEDR